MSIHNLHTDSDLVALLATGNQAAFEAIYRKYAPGLYRYARKNIQHKEDCEEIVQEVFESLWKNREGLQRETMVIEAYLIKMVRYKIIRYFQHQSVIRKFETHYTLFEATYETLNEDQRTPESIQASIVKLLAGLPDRCKLAFTLRLQENLSNSEIAARMNISKQTVENYMGIALAHLRKYSHHLYKLTHE